MRLTQILIHTLREDPADAEIPSHRLLARGGYIVKIAAGIYSYSPLMWRVIKKVYNIVREELDREDAQEVMLPIMQPKELWVSSGRQQLQAAAGQPLPDPGQVPRRDPAALRTDARSRVHHDGRVLVRCRRGGPRRVVRRWTGLPGGSSNGGVEFTVVQADAGAIGGAAAARSSWCSPTPARTRSSTARSGYAANVEKADAEGRGGRPTVARRATLEKHETPDVRTVEQLQEFFDLPAEVDGQDRALRGRPTPSTRRSSR